MAPESFPRGKAPPPASTSTADQKQPAGPSSRGPPSTGGGGPAAKRKREAKAAGSSSSTTTPSGTSGVSKAAAAKGDEGPDFLFGLPKKKPKQSASDGGGSTLASDGRDGLVDEASKIAQAVGLGCVTKAGRAPPQIQPVSLKRFARGTAVLGIVTRVGPKDIGVALPGGISGRVSFPEVSDPLFARFSAAAAGAVMDPLQHQEATLRLVLAALRPGQVVRAVVLTMPAAADKHKGSSASSSGGKASQKLSLTLRASVVNRGLKLEHLLPGGALSGAVASVEDHGYVIATGLEGITAFLARKHVKGGADAEAQLTEGSPVEVVVLAVKEEARSITCGFDPSVTPKALTRGSALTLQGLKPGMLVNAAVDMLLKNGLALTFLGGFSGVVTLEHLDRPYVDNDWRKRFRLGDMLQARVLLVDAQSKAVYLTLRTHLLGLRPASGLPEVSQVLAQAKVLRVEPKKGLLLGFLLAAAEGGGGKDLDTYDDEARIGAELASRRTKKARAKEDGEDDGVKAEAGGDPEEAKLQKILEGPRYVPVFVQASQVEALASVSVGQTVACRVIGTAPVEGAVHGSMKAATLEAPFVRLADVTPGQRVQAKVTAVAGWGLTLDLGQGIRAHCTNMHLADGAGPKTTSLRAKALAEAKKGKGGRGVYQAGQQVSCRILQVDLATRKVYATLKPSLLKDAPDTVVAAYSEAAPGRTCLGFVTKVGDFGVIVTFYGNVHGLLPAKHLAAQGVENPAEAFRLGQVLRCVVASCEPHRDPPRLSLRLDVPEEAGGEDEGGKQAQAQQLRPGQRVSGTVERVQDPYAMVRLDGRGSKEPLAFLHKHQLGDHAALADQLFARLAKGSRVEDALVLELRRDREGPLLSLKPLLIRADGGGILDHAAGKTSAPATDEPVKLQDLKVGEARLCGYISRVENFGLFVRFVGGQVALAPRGLIADRFVEDASGLFREGDSVRCLLHRVDADKGKVYVTTQRSQLPVTDTAFLETLLSESVAAASSSSSSSISEATEESDALDWRRYAVGATVNATVTAVKDYGVVLSGEDHRTVMLAPGPEHVLACAPHDEVKVRVLDVDWAKRVLVVTLLPELVKRGRSKHRKSAAGLSLPVGARGEAEVVLKRDRYAVVEVGGALAYLAVADYQCPYLATGNLEVGIKVDVVVRRPWRLVLEGKPSLAYPQEPVMLVTLAQEQDVAEGEEAPKAGASKKAQKEFKKLQQQKEKEKKAEAAAQQRISAKESKAAAAADKAERKPAAAEHVVRKRARAIAASEVVVGATLPAMVVEVRPDELVLALNIQRDEEEEEQETGKKMKGKKAAPARVLAKVFVTHGRQRLVDLEEAATEALEAKQAKKGKGEEEASLPSFHPLAPYEVGQELDVRVVEVREKELSKVKLLECSLRPQDAQACADPVALQPAWETLTVGTILLGVVTEVQAEGLWVAVSRAIKGFVHYLDIARDGETGLFARITEAGAVGVPVPVVVTHVDPARHRLQLSIRGVPLTDDLDPARFPLLPSAASKLAKGEKGEAAVGASFLPNVGDLLTGRVCLGPHAPVLNPPSVAIQLGHRVFGRLCITEMDEPDHWVDQPLSRPACALEDGQDVRCRVVAVEKGRIDVSLRPSRLQPDVAIKAATAEDGLPEEGAVVKGYVVGTSTKGCFVRVARGVTARVLIKDLADGFVKSPTEAFPVGKLVAGRVLKLEEEGGTGKAAGSGPRVDLSLRPSVVVGKHLHQLAFEDVEEGMKLKGAVVRVEPFGVFVKLQGSDLTGMCHVSEVSDQRVKDLTKAYEPGDVVKALVLKVDREAKRISLSLKASHFKGDEEKSDEEEDDESDSGMEETEEEESESLSGEGESDSEDMEEEDEEQEDDDEPENVKVPLADSSSDEELLVEDDDEDEEAAMMEVDGEEDSEEEEEDGDEEEDVKKNKSKSKSKASAVTRASTAPGPSFQWDDFNLGLGSSATAGQGAASPSEEEDSDDDDEEEEGGKSRHRSSRKKAAQRKREEEEVRKREERLLDPNAPPESTEDFERLVIANPNSSLVWIRYMAFQLSLADIDAARALAARALKTIVFREETEKMNVWVALLNLEHRYGTKESVLDTLEKAAEQNNPKHVYLHVAEMYERAGETGEAEEIFKNTLTKRFKYSKKVWKQYHLLVLKRDPTEATELLRRSLQCLSRHKHALVISHFAQAEFEHGSVDRGRTIFEGLVSSFPKRLDLWNVYVDKEIKAGHVDAARRLLDRMCTLRLSAQKAKGTLKKYMQLELSHGDSASVERVKAKAVEFVRSNMSG